MDKSQDASNRKEGDIQVPCWSLVNRIVRQQMPQLPQFQASWAGPWVCPHPPTQPGGRTGRWDLLLARPSVCRLLVSSQSRRISGLFPGSSGMAEPARRAREWRRPRLCCPRGCPHCPDCVATSSRVGTPRSIMLEQMRHVINGTVRMRWHACAHAHARRPGAQPLE